MLISSSNYELIMVYYKRRKLFCFHDIFQYIHLYYDLIFVYYDNTAKMRHDRKIFIAITLKCPNLDKAISNLIIVKGWISTITSILMISQGKSFDYHILLLLAINYNIISINSMGFKIATLGGLQVCIYPTPSPRAGCHTRSIFKKCSWFEFRVLLPQDWLLYQGSRTLSALHESISPSTHSWVEGKIFVDHRGKGVNLTWSRNDQQYYLHSVRQANQFCHISLF